MTSERQKRAMVRDARRQYGAAPTPTADLQPGGKVVRDSFQNAAAALGWGTNNQSSGSMYSFDNLSNNRAMLEGAYQSNWIAGVAIDVVAEDMTREGIEISTSLDPGKVEEVQQAFVDLGLWESLCDTIRWGRLYGGAIGVLLVEGQNLSTELRADSCGKDQFKGIVPLDRWQVWPDMQHLVQEQGPDLGMPLFYNVMPGPGIPLAGEKIHYSRVIRAIGNDLPYWRRISFQLWGASVLERLWDRIVAFDSATIGAAQLVYKAHLRTYKVKDLRTLLAAGGPGMTVLLKQMEFVRSSQTNEGLTLMDAEDEFEANAYAFTGLPDMILQFGQQIAGSLQVPLVRLFGQAPAGLNATGESDQKTYAEGIKRRQNRALRRRMSVVIELVARSTLGQGLPDGTTWDWNTIYQMSEPERATVAQQKANAILDAYEAQVIDLATALKELRALGRPTGIFTNITDEAIEAAKDAPPPGAEVALDQPPGAANDPDNEGTRTGAQGNARSRAEAKGPAAREAS